MPTEQTEEQKKEHARRQKEAADRFLEDQARKRGETVKPLVNTQLTDPVHIGKHAEEPHLDPDTVTKLRDQHPIEGGIKTADIEHDGEKVGEVVTQPETTVPGASAPESNRQANQAAEAAGTKGGASKKAADNKHKREHKR